MSCMSPSRSRAQNFLALRETGSGVVLKLNYNSPCRMLARRKDKACHACRLFAISRAVTYTSYNRIDIQMWQTDENKSYRISAMQSEQSCVTGLPTHETLRINLPDLSMIKHLIRSFGLYFIFSYFICYGRYAHLCRCV